MWLYISVEFRLIKTPNRLGDEVNQLHVYLTGMFFWGKHQIQNFISTCVFPGPSCIWPLPHPDSAQTENLGEGRLGNQFQTFREETKQTEGFGYQVDVTAGQRSTNQWLSCTRWPSSFLTSLMTSAVGQRLRYAAARDEHSRLSVMRLIQIFTNPEYTLGRLQQQSPKDRGEIFQGNAGMDRH